MDIREGVIEALDYASNALDDPKIAPILLSGKDIRLSDVSTDSLARLEFIIKLEDGFDIEIDEDELTEDATLTSLQALIEAKLTEKTNAG
mgnify:FL=1